MIAQILRTAAVVALTGVATFAQSDLKATIPFAFSTPAGGHMSAGKYSINKLNSPSATATYKLYNYDTKASVLAMTQETVKRPAGETAYKGVLAFKCAGDVCALSGIYPAGSQTGFGVPVKLKPVAPATEIAEIRIPFGE